MAISLVHPPQKITNIQLSDEMKEEIRFCIRGLAFGQRYCMCDFLDPNLDIKKLHPSMMLCNECFRQLQFSYEIFSNRIAGLREDFFESYLAVKTATILSNIKKQIDRFGCGCGRKDCNINLCNSKERDIIQRKFNAMYAAFAFNIIPTNTLSDIYRRSGRVSYN
jgi:hypothetical protein